jgi:hypothetical protein
VVNNSWARRDRAAYKLGYSSGRSALDITPGPNTTGNPRSLSWWSNGGKYIDSLLQAWWPKEYAGGLDQAYHYLPKARKEYWYTHE